MSKSTLMEAAAINRFGGLDEIKIQKVPVPKVGENEVLIKVAFAGVGSWEPFEREGGYAQMQGVQPTFPYVLGSEGVGTVVKVGEKVVGFNKGDVVYAAAFLNPKGGFYAEYVVVNDDLIARVPKQFTLEQASCVLGVGLTALRGLNDTLHVAKGETLMIFGASGPMGHIAVQLAKRMRAKVFAVAAGQDGVELAKKVGADVAVDGHKDDIVAAAKEFAEGGIDAAYMTAGGDAAQKALDAVMKKGSRAAYPTGVFPEPEHKDHYKLLNFNGEPDKDLLERFTDLIGKEDFYVSVAKVFDLRDAAKAQEALGQHYNGKIVIRIAK
jgi:NADPH2:quinone reductase